MIGTLINVMAVLLGGSLGTILGDRLPERVRETVLQHIGLLLLALKRIRGANLLPALLIAPTIVVVLQALGVGGIGRGDSGGDCRR